MKKRVVSIGMLLVIVLLFAGCPLPDMHPPDCDCEACKQAAELNGYKADAKLALEAYAEGKGQDNYAVEDWAVIDILITDGKAAVDTAASMPEVDEVTASAQAVIDEVLQKEEVQDIKRQRIPEGSTIYTYDAWWGEKVKVYVVFPRTVQQGEPFSVKVTTINVSGSDMEYSAKICCVEKGVRILGFRPQVDGEWKFELRIYHWNFFSFVPEYDKVIIPRGGKLTALWEIATCLSASSEPWNNIAPKGEYDIYFSNGEIYKTALEII